MKITSNYNRNDWIRFWCTVLITTTPTILWAIFVVTIGIQHLLFGAEFLNYLVDSEVIADFRDYMIGSNNVESGGELLIWFFMGWLGFLTFPIFASLWISSKIPTKWIIKKLNVEPKMKLVLFKNGKPIGKKQS